MMGIIGKKTENELNVTSSDLNYELWTWTHLFLLYELNFKLVHVNCELAQHWQS